MADGWQNGLPLTPASGWKLASSFASFPFKEGSYYRIACSPHRNRSQPQLPRGPQASLFLAPPRTAPLPNRLAPAQPKQSMGLHIAPSSSAELEHQASSQQKHSSQDSTTSSSLRPRHMQVVGLIKCMAWSLGQSK